MDGVIEFFRYTRGLLYDVMHRNARYSYNFNISRRYHVIGFDGRLYTPGGFIQHLLDMLMDFVIRIHESINMLEIQLDYFNEFFSYYVNNSSIILSELVINLQDSFYELEEFIHEELNL